jgi:hypothetical protein
MIRIDRAHRSIVVVCACGARDVFLTATAADRWALEHVYRAHPRTDDAGENADRDRAIQASSVRRRRGLG